VGGALGFLAGGPVGAALLGTGSAAAAMTLKHIGEEVSERLLGPREKVRIGAVLAISASDIQDRIKKGEKLANISVSRFHLGLRSFRLKTPRMKHGTSTNGHSFFVEISRPSECQKRA